MYTYNSNLAPTIFLAPSQKELYVYYTNVRSGSQLFAFDPGSLEDAYGGGTVTLSSSVSGEILDADQLYSTAGNSALYKINSAYTTAGAVPTCSLTVLAENTYEISSLDAITPSTTCPGGFSITGGICVTVPGYSMGYFVIPFTVTPRLGVVDDIYSIYPNPASTYFRVQQIDNINGEDNNILVEIYSIYGGLIQRLNVTENESIDISQLPVGVYNVLIKTEGSNKESESLIKMK
jgi:hypothetical protein